MSLPQLHRPVQEYAGGVEDGEECGDGEQRGGDEAVVVLWGDEVEQGRGDGADVDCEVEPFLWEVGGTE